MFPTFIGILDIQSWWEVPSIAHFCSLFKDTFNLLDFDIEDLEEALLTDGSTDNHLLQELIVKLLEGCLPHDTRNDISIFNYQMFLRRLFRKKCQEYNCKNPFNTDVDFELLPLRQKVEILWALCDFRLDTKDVEESLIDLDSDCLRVEPLGHDRKNSAYWYFYGTRLYREDYIKTSNFISQKQKNKQEDKKHKRHRNRLAKEEEEEKAEKNSIVYRNKDKSKESIWQVVCFTLQDWNRLVEKFKDSEYATERKLYRTLSEDFMPEIPKLFDFKEKQQRRKILQHSGVRMIKNYVHEKIQKSIMVKSKIKTKTNKGTKKSVNLALKNVKVDETVATPVQKKGRQTNNSLASAVGQIVIDTRDEVTDTKNKKGTVKHGNSICSSYGYEYNFDIEEEEQQIGMHKVLKILKDHEDSWPFIDPVDEQYAPRYYSVVRRPMDLSTMEDKLEDGSYKTINQFKRDFRLIIDNCKQYNGSDNEYTEMVMSLKEVFDRAVDRYLEYEQSSEDSLSVGSDAGINPLNCKKNYSPSIRHSQRHKHLRKLNKKAKFNIKINKKKIRQRVYVDSAKTKNKGETKISKIKEKNGRKKIKICKNEMKLEESNVHQENKDAINDINVIKSKRQKLNNEHTLSKIKKILIKEEIENESIKINKNINKVIQDNKPHSTKELNKNKKRKDDFEENYDSISIPKSKTRKVEKKENKELDHFITRIKKSKIKKVKPQVKLLGDNEKVSFLSEKSKKITKINKEKLKSLCKKSVKEKDKYKNKNDNSLNNGEVEKESYFKNCENIKNTSKIVVKKLESLITTKDIESLDSLKDKISENRKKEKLKIEQEKKRNQSFKNEYLYLTSKKVPSNSNTYNVDKLGSKQFKSKILNKEEKNSENSSENIDDFLPKKMKTYSKHTKGSARRDPTIHALNQATEQTLNDINKWLDGAPKLSEFSLGSDSPVFHTLTNDLLKTTSSKHSKVTSTLTTTVVVTGVTTVATDVLPRKRINSMKFFGPCISIKPKKIQRTIDRLQPGKSKGNLLSKKPLMNDNASVIDTIISQSIGDNDQANRELNNEPKLSLGTVLRNADSIQLICKSLVSSPNANLSNDDDDEESVNKPIIPLINTIEGQPLKAIKKITASKLKDAKIEKQIDNEKIQKSKSVTPNLSAWFKAFGVPKLKKKEEEEEIASFSSLEKKESLENSNPSGNRQRRISTGGSSISESVSSYSQESPPSRSDRSPQQNQQLVSVLHSPATIEPQIRGAGFYQDALSTGSSPYNSPYYTTPPRYSAQLPPTPSPQNHPLSPAYPLSVNFDPSGVQVPASTILYSQLNPQILHQSFKLSPQAHSPTFSHQSSQNCFSQNSPQCESQPLYTVSTITVSENQSPVYMDQSSQLLQSSPYQQQNPGTPVTSYSQSSPSQASPLKFPQSSSQQQQSPYSQSSPQSSASYSQSQSQQHSPYPQSSSQQHNFSQISPKPPSSTYSQSSPQPSGYVEQTSNPYSQSELVIAQTSPQQSSNYSQPSSQISSRYSTQLSPQQKSPAYSKPLPPMPPSYLESSLQQCRSYLHPSSQQTSEQVSVNSIQQQQAQIVNFSESLNQQQSQQPQHQIVQTVQTIFTKNSENYTQSLSTPLTPSIKLAYSQSSIATSKFTKKPTTAKDKQQENNEHHLTTLNHQMYQTASSSRYSPTYPANVFPTTDRVSGQLVNESLKRSVTSKLMNLDTQQLAHQKQVHQNQEPQTQLLNFQQNLTSHESLYSSGFQTTSYSMSNVACRSIYPGYFDTSDKGTTGTSGSGNNLVSVKKRIYNETLTGTDDTSTQRSSNQEQFGFDSLMTLTNSQSDISVAVSNQFDSAFANSLTDSVTANPAYTRLQLGLVARSTKDTQQLLSISRGTSKKDTLATYGRTTASTQSELDLSLLQNLKNTAIKNSSMLPITCRVPELPCLTAKSKKNRKNKQQQLNISEEQQSNIPNFSQYGSVTSDAIGLKQSTVDGRTFNFSASANTATNTSSFYNKEASASAAAAAYAFLDDFRNPNLPNYYTMAFRQQVQQQQQVPHQQVQQQINSTSNVVQVCNKLNSQTTRNYSGHPFLHSTQRPTPYRPSVPSYVTPHAANLGVDPAAYQQYLHSLYALQPPPHHRSTWL